MKQTLKRSLSCLLAAVMIATFFAGCISDEKSITEADASAVNYNADGSYTTQITLENANFKGLTANDITVVYSVFDKEAYHAALKENADGNTDDNNDVDIDEYFSDAQAEVTAVDADDSTMTVSFVDDKAAENVTNGYSVFIESKNIGAFVNVEFTDYIITPEVEYVLSSDEDIQLTLKLENGEFSEDISKDHISLGGSFEGMEIEGISATEKSLTIQLEGKPTKFKSAGAYIDGLVYVDKDGIKNAHTATLAKVPVQTVRAYFESDKMTANGSTVTVPLTLIDIVDLDSLTKNSFSFDSGVTVTGCTKDSDTQVTLTMTVDGAKDKNSAAKVLNGQTVKIGNDYEFTASFASATFYSVLDYVEEDGGDLKLTLDLYVHGGTFADKLTNEMFSFGYDFEKASVVSVERTDDYAAELIISVPESGQTEETLDMYGEILLAAGTLVNRWGDKTEERAECLKRFVQSDMSRDLSEVDINNIKNIVGGFGNTTFGTIKSVASGAVTGVNAVKTILEMTGLIQSEHAEVMNKLNEISNQLKQIQGTLAQILQLVKLVQKAQYETLLQDFNAAISAINSDCNYLEQYFAAGADLGWQPDDDAPVEDWNNYIQKMLDEEDNNNLKFFDFKETVLHLKDQYGYAARQLALTDETNPLYLVDEICTLTYNFDTGAYPERVGYRVNVQHALERALSYLALFYGTDNQENNNLYTNAMNGMDNHEVEKIEYPWPYSVGAVGDHIYCYTLNTWIRAEDYYYISHSAKGSAAILNDIDYSPNRNFTPEEMDDFVSRMSGRTFRQEMKLSSIYIDDKTAGFSFSWEHHNNGDWKWSSARHYTNYYADAGLWDDTTITKRLNTWYEDGSKTYYDLRQWVISYAGGHYA